MPPQSQKTNKQEEKDSDLLEEGMAIDPVLAKAIREERKKAGLSTQELSKKIGHSPSYINKIETLRLQTSTAELAKIEKALNRPPGYFFPGAIHRAMALKSGKSKLDLVRELKERIEQLEILEAYDEQQQLDRLKAAKKRRKTDSTRRTS